MRGALLSDLAHKESNSTTVNRKYNTLHCKPHAYHDELVDEMFEVEASLLTLMIECKR